MCTANLYQVYCVGDHLEYNIAVLNEEKYTYPVIWNKVT